MPKNKHNRNAGQNLFEYATSVGFVFFHIDNNLSRSKINGIRATGKMGKRFKCDFF